MSLSQSDLNPVLRLLVGELQVEEDFVEHNRHLIYIYIYI